MPGLQQSAELRSNLNGSKTRPETSRLIRFNGLYGRASAAEMVGKNEKAAAYHTQLVRVCDGIELRASGTGRAKALLAKNTV